MFIKFITHIKESERAESGHCIPMDSSMTLQTSKASVREIAVKSNDEITEIVQEKSDMYIINNLTTHDEFKSKSVFIVTTDDKSIATELPFFLMNDDGKTIDRYNPSIYK